MNTGFWEKLKKEIHEKAVENDYCDAEDETLSNSIVAMIQAEKSPGSINEDLLSLVGLDYDLNLTDWFLERKRELESTEESAINLELLSQESCPTPERSCSKSNARDRRSRSQSNSFDYRSRSPSASFGRRRSSSRDSHERRSRSPYRHSHRSNNRYKRRYSDTYYECYSRSSSLRIDNRDKRHRIHKQSRVNVFDRLGPVKAFRNETKKIRCKYWPTCNKGIEQCKFFHPTKVCRNFPHCEKKSSECCFVHPQVNTPPVPLKPIIRIPSPFVAPQQASIMQPANHTPRALLPCHKGSQCQARNCRFLHPNNPMYYARQVCHFDGVCQNVNCVYRHTKLDSQKNTA
ncbi:hypothetical protein [Parasitella parasitica]|uniref:C3H1-type domain-containing protein n=1 Tax=Parasitella parasitica TaxID=35722 RepID=A0A0B7NWU4_9FUNG|nr:hypothetical protein [Parasitella parasitica]